MTTPSDRPSRLPPALRGVVIVGMCSSVLAMPFAASVAAAQATSAAPASSRSSSAGKNTAANRLKYLIVGAATGGVLATGYYFISEHGRNSSSCAPWSCALPFLSLSGAFSALFIQKDVSAQHRAEAPRVGSALQFSTSEVLLPAAPLAVAIRDSLAAVATDSGAQLTSTTEHPVALRRRGIGLSDMRQVALLPSAPNLLVGTGFALWEGSVGAGQLSRAYDGPIDALAASDNGVLAASGSTLLYRRGSGSAATIDSLKAPSAVSAAVHDPVTGQFWVSTDSALLEVLVNGNTIALGRKFAVPAKALAIAVSPEWIVAVLGSEGLAVWRRDALGASVVTPVRLRDEPRFAFDAAFLGSDLYVAGGVDGLFRVSLSPIPQVLGSSRQIRYATSVHADKGVLWVGDRSRQALVRVTPR